MPTFAAPSPYGPALKGPMQWALGECLSVLHSASETDVPVAASDAALEHWQ